MPDPATGMPDQPQCLTVDELTVDELAIDELAIDQSMTGNSLVRLTHRFDDQGLLLLDLQNRNPSQHACMKSGQRWFPGPLGLAFCWRHRLGNRTRIR